MSTVRMSDYLRDDIIGAYETSYDKANPRLEINSKYGDKLYNTYVGNNVEVVITAAEKAFGDLFDAKTLFAKANELTAQAPITISRIIQGDDGEKIADLKLSEDHVFAIPLSTERLIPRIISESSYYNSATPVKFKFDRYTDKNFNYICEILEHNSKLDTNKKLSSTKVDDLLKKFTTLNQAIKAWPALSKLVKPEKLAKIHEKQERKRKQDLQKEIADEVVIGSDLNKTILAGALLGGDD